jgi:hypothetical protein
VYEINNKKYKCSGLYYINHSCLLTVNKTFSQTETLPAGAFIINMGNTSPTFANTLKAYGLIWDIIKNDKVQVKWVIGQTKVKDGVDFTYNSLIYYTPKKPFCRLNSTIHRKIGLNNK